MRGWKEAGRVKVWTIGSLVLGFEVTPLVGPLGVGGVRGMGRFPFVGLSPFVGIRMMTLKLKPPSASAVRQSAVLSVVPHYLVSCPWLRLLVSLGDAHSKKCWNSTISLLVY